MALHIIVGTQWGDEGKGRIVDWFAAKSEYVARFNGGDNAGHSVTVGDTLFKLHLIPSGIIHEGAIAVLGNGMVINPQSLLAEMDMLKDHHISVEPVFVIFDVAALRAWLCDSDCFQLFSARDPFF